MSEAPDGSDRFFAVGQAGERGLLAVAGPCEDVGDPPPRKNLFFLFYREIFLSF